MRHCKSGTYLGVRMTFILLCTTMTVAAQEFTVDSIMQNGRRANRINLAYLSDGYTATQLPDFVEHAKQINASLFDQSPFSEYRKFFNAFVIKVPSNQPGAVHPGDAVDEFTAGGQPVDFPDNYFKSTFDYASVHRALVPVDFPKISEVLANNLPDYDQAIMIVNSPFYGGSGGLFATSSVNLHSAEIAIHELGHSFAGLADEYWPGIGYAAERPNMTRDNNPETVRWRQWLGINNTGIFPYGQGYPESTWFKPNQSCKMQNLGYPFCSVCTERLVDRIHEMVFMIDNFSPASTTLSLIDNRPVTLSVNTVEADPSSSTISWFLNEGSTPFAVNQAAVSIPASALQAGNNTVVVQVIDNPPTSKSYLPAAGYISEITWTINKAASALPVKLKAFSGKSATAGNVLDWEIDNEEDLSYFELEKSTDGVRFSKVATIHAGRDAERYQFIDRVLAPFCYFRLKIVEKDGHTFYSHTIWLRNAVDKFSYKVYQNPKAKRYHLTLSSLDRQRVSAKIVGSNGAVVFFRDFGMIKDHLDYNISLAGKSGGVYYLILNIGGKNHTVQLLVN